MIESTCILERKLSSSNIFAGLILSGHKTQIRIPVVPNSFKEDSFSGECAVYFPHGIKGDTFAVKDTKNNKHGIIEITNIRCEYLWAINDEDCIKEGSIEYIDEDIVNKEDVSPRCAFKCMWGSPFINLSFDRNPLVWVIDFKLLDNA